MCVYVGVGRGEVNGCVCIRVMCMVESFVCVCGGQRLSSGPPVSLLIL